MNLVPRIRKHTRRTPEKLRQLLADYQNSGLTQKEFALRVGMGYSNFAQWLGQAWKLEASAPDATTAALVPVVLGRRPVAPFINCAGPVAGASILGMVSIRASCANCWPNIVAL